MNAYARASRGGYPDEPGWKAPGRDTSKAAAAGVAPKAKSIRARVYDCLKDGHPRTPEEIAAMLGIPVMNVRPRLSELFARGLVTDSGTRGLAFGGRSAIAWRITGKTDATR